MSFFKGPIVSLQELTDADIGVHEYILYLANQSYNRKGKEELLKNQIDFNKQEALNRQRLKKQNKLVHDVAKLHQQQVIDELCTMFHVSSHDLKTKVLDFYEVDPVLAGKINNLVQSKDQKKCGKDATEGSVFKFDSLFVCPIKKQSHFPEF